MNYTDPQDREGEHVAQVFGLYLWLGVDAPQAGVEMLEREAARLFSPGGRWGARPASDAA